MKPNRLSTSSTPPGKEIAYQRTGQALDRARFRTFDWTFPQGYQVNVVRVSLPLHIPAAGYTTLTLRPAAAVKPAAMLRQAWAGYLRSARWRMQFLAVDIRSRMGR